MGTIHKKQQGELNMSIGEKRTLNAYYKRRFYRGRTAFARAADFIALRIILLIACYLWFSFNVESIIAAAVLTAGRGHIRICRACKKRAA
jgi:hypothetical protein